jgi:hypothetical protein
MPSLEKYQNIENLKEDLLKSTPNGFDIETIVINAGFKPTLSKIK